MNAPREIIPFAVYTPEEATELLGIGLDKLDKLVGDGDLPTLRYTTRRRFWGESLIALCRDYGGPS
jgi:excisionase family DNA binding protein